MKLLETKPQLCPGAKHFSGDQVWRKTGLFEMSPVVPASHQELQEKKKYPFFLLKLCKYP